ncbi:hypothetical protein H2201_005047 [Coniosporium apollinis]|uniref:Uncharacterized protein n=2 Tax=Coniosporium TaxID=2810619 RepID=A0ABQ9NT41_9PEZI|nr:hypothetical protein H2199_000700 [Cladosporium sp. JES 115]KAJ9664826.1 hypothetical protein H2201_005047 [Coniosporium apollinis]
MASKTYGSQTSNALRPGRLLLTFVALMTSFACFVADWNETHIYNPTWPPHAKFHNGQTMSMGLLLGLATLWYTYRPVGSASRVDRIREDVKEGDARKQWALKVEKQKERMSLDTAAVLASLYWVTQLMAFAYPDVAAVDPPGDPNALPIQLPISGVLLACTGLGYWLEAQRLSA